MTTMVFGGAREIGASREGANGKEVLFALYPEGWKAKEPERVHVTATLRWWPAADGRTRAFGLRGIYSRSRMWMFVACSGLRSWPHLAA